MSARQELFFQRRTLMFCGTDSTPCRPTLSIAIPFAVNHKMCFPLMKRKAAKYTNIGVLRLTGIGKIKTLDPQAFAIHGLRRRFDSCCVREGKSKATREIKSPATKELELVFAAGDEGCGAGEANGSTSAHLLTSRAGRPPCECGQTINLDMPDAARILSQRRGCLAADSCKGSSYQIGFTRVTIKMFIADT